MDTQRIVQVRAFVPVPVEAGADDESRDHWLDSQVASPMDPYPDYRGSRWSSGFNALGRFVVEVEAELGEVGIGVSTGGIPACWVVEHHLSRFLEGQRVELLEQMWDQMWRATLFYGRKGLVVHAISAVDLALWDLLGRLRGEPVYALIGGAAREELELYATGPRPDIAKSLGFVGAKLPLPFGPAAGEEGLQKNLGLAAEMRERVGCDFLLAYDCWMALDLNYALRFIDGLRSYGFAWVEECLPPDDYWGYAELRRKAPAGMLIATGEHEAGLFGFRLLLEMSCCDILQPDVTWCGGLTELLRIAECSDSHGVSVIPHGSSIYGYHFALARADLPFAEFVMRDPQGASIVPPSEGLFEDEPLPRNGRLRISDSPGFGIQLGRSVRLERPFPR